jgi:hypothetical protein
VLRPAGPSTTQLQTDVPRATEPSTAHPQTTVPRVVEPSTADAQTAVPQTTVLRPVRPSTAESQTSELRPVEPGTAGPQTSAPCAVEPSAAKSHLTEPLTAKSRKANSRYIPRAVVREVHRRDAGQCTFVSAEGKRCAERGFLEFHHDEPYARGGEATVENVRLVCRAHNALFAERDYGKAFMRSKRTPTGDAFNELVPRNES